MMVTTRPCDAIEICHYLFVSPVAECTGLQSVKVGYESTVCARRFAPYGEIKLSLYEGGPSVRIVGQCQFVRPSVHIHDPMPVSYHLQIAFKKFIADAGVALQEDSFGAEPFAEFVGPCFREKLLVYLSVSTYACPDGFGIEQHKV